MKKWRCTVCNYIHTGDAPPDKCPECSVGPDKFVELDDQGLRQPIMNKEELDKALPAVFKISYGMFVVSSHDGAGKVNAQVANSIVQVTSDPVQVSAGINKLNLTHEYIEKSGVFVVHILGEEDINSIRRFGFRSGRDIDKFAKVSYHTEKTGAPILDDGHLGYLECKVVSKLDAGTHTIFLGEVVGGSLLADKQPMTYQYYRNNK